MSKFSEAFAAARKAGKSTFTFNGESYNTRMKSQLPAVDVGKSSSKSGASSDTKWSPPAEIAHKRGAASAPTADEAVDKQGWVDAGTQRYKRGGAVKKAAGAATLSVTRSNRDYGKKAYAKGGSVKGKCS